MGAQTILDIQASQASRTAEWLFAQWELEAYPLDGQPCPGYCRALRAFQYAGDYGRQIILTGPETRAAILILRHGAAILDGLTPSNTNPSH